MKLLILTGLMLSSSLIYSTPNFQIARGKATYIPSFSRSSNIIIKRKVETRALEEALELIVSNCGPIYFHLDGDAKFTILPYGIIEASQRYKCL